MKKNIFFSILSSTIRNLLDKTKTMIDIRERIGQTMNRIPFQGCEHK